MPLVIVCPTLAGTLRSCYTWQLLLIAHKAIQLIRPCLHSCYKPQTVEQRTQEGYALLTLLICHRLSSAGGQYVIQHLSISIVFMCVYIGFAVITCHGATSLVRYCMFTFRHSLCGNSACSPAISSSLLDAIGKDIKLSCLSNHKHCRKFWVSSNPTCW